MRAARSLTRIARALALTAAALLIAGLFLPLMTVEKFFFFKDTVSIASMIETLFVEGATAIAVLVLGFSVVFPTLKLSLIFLSSFGDHPGAARRVSAALAAGLGKWSMVDVFVVALSIVALKGTGVVKVFDHAGVYVFAASVICAQFAGLALEVGLKRLERAAAQPALDPNGGPVERPAPLQARHERG